MASENVYSAEYVPPRTGMSGTTKVILGVGLGCGFLMLLACGGLIVFWVSFVKKAQITDPVAVQALADTIVSIHPPGDLKPIQAMDVKIPLAPVRGEMAIFAGDDGTANLSLAQATSEGDQAGEVGEDALKQMLMQMVSQARLQTKNELLSEEKSGEHEVEIHGEPAHFTLVTGKDRAGVEIREVQGDFRGAKGPATLIFQGKADKFSVEDLKAMLDSMK